MKHMSTAYLTFSRPFDHKSSLNSYILFSVKDEVLSYCIDVGAQNVHCKKAPLVSRRVGI